MKRFRHRVAAPGIVPGAFPPGRAGRAVRTMVALCALMGATGFVGTAEARCDLEKGEPCACPSDVDSAVRARKALVKKVESAFEAKLAPDAIGGGCVYFNSKAFPRDAKRCRSGDALACDAVFYAIDNMYMDEGTGEDPSCERVVKAFVRGQGEDGRVTRWERRCLAGGDPDVTAYACVLAVEGLAGGSSGMEYAPLRGKRGQYEYLCGEAPPGIGYSRVAPETYRESKRLERLFDAGCKAGDRLSCDWIVHAAPAG